MDLAKQIMGLILILLAVLPFLWWGRIWIGNFAKVRGKTQALFVVLALAFLVYLLLVIWPRK